MSVFSLSGKQLAPIAQLSIVAMLIGTGLAQQAAAQVGFSSPVQLSDNAANQGSPTLIMFNNQLTMYYVNHSNNTIYVDFGLSGHPQSTGIVVNSAELTDVGATVLRGQVLLSYAAPNNSVVFALSSNGINFSGGVVPPPTALGLPGNASPNSALVPALVSDGSTAYTAVVGSTTGFVYVSRTYDGISFAPITPSGGPVTSNFLASSRPSLTLYQGAPWVAFTSYGLNPYTNPNYQPTYIVGGNAAIPSVNPLPGAGGPFGNNNRDYHFAGASIINYNGVLYVFYQSSSSSQDLNYIYSGNGFATGANALAGNQMRWTPSLAVTPANQLYLVYQDNGNTNISFRHN